MRALPLLLLLAACGPSGPTFGLSRAGEDPRRLVFNNATEPEYIDPGQATGHPDGRIIGALFDGLTEYDPVDLSPRPGLAESWEAHPDGRGYTFQLRRNAVWSNGRAITAQDFVWSWERVLHPIFLARYAQQLYAVHGAQAYNEGRLHTLAAPTQGLDAGTVVELVDSNVVSLLDGAELKSAPDGMTGTPLPAGRIVQVLERGEDFVQVQFDAGCPDLGDQVALAACANDAPTSGWVAASLVEPAFPMASERITARDLTLRNDDGVVTAQLTAGSSVVLRKTNGSDALVYSATEERFGWAPLDALVHPRGAVVRFTAQVVEPLDFSGAVAPVDTAEPDSDAPSEPVALSEPVTIELSPDALCTEAAALGVRAVDEHTLSVRLQGVAPYFLQQTSHTTLRAVPREAVMAHGARWTRPENIVTSGPFLLDEHVVRDHFRLVRNDDWHSASELRLDEVIAYSIDNQTTSANLYRAGYTDFVVANDIPAVFIPMLDGKDDFHTGPKLSTYFYRLNTERPPLNDERVRRALSLAIDRDEVVLVNRKGDLPATHIVPPGLPGYTPAEGVRFDPEEARRLLADAGYPDGEGFPSLSILYNTLESHKLIAAVIQEQWRQHLGIEVELENREWKTYLKSVHAMDYDIARAGWIGDYLDPNTFLDLWVTGGGNNETGWSSREYDLLIEAAGREPDPAKRMSLLRDAEQIVTDEAPFLPIYWYADAELRQPDVRGYHTNLMDQHPIQAMWLDRPSAGE